MSPVVFVCDEGSGIGLGHRRRCEAIARELKTLGVESAVVASMKGVVGAPVVVVDSYRARADDRRWFVPDHVVAIDDLGRNLAVDVVVVPAPGADAGIHTNASLVLAGARYALVDPALRYLNRRPPWDGASPARVVVTMGAADDAGVGQVIARRCQAQLPDAEVRLVIGPWGDQRVPPGIEAVHCDSGLGETLADSDVVVTAGGVTLLESMALGRPTIVVMTAENQCENIRSVVAAGAAVEADRLNVGDHVARLLGNAALRSAMAQRAGALIDCDGARRVARVIATLCVAPMAANR